MGWQDLLQKKNEQIIIPWLGGRIIRKGPRSWTINGELPVEHGWHSFTIYGRKAIYEHTGNLDEVSINDTFDYFEYIKGYLVGDHIVPDDASVDPDPVKIAEQTEQVHLIERGLGRFVRIRAGRIYEDGPLVFSDPDMPLGPEDSVVQAFENRLPSINYIPGVTPALNAAFNMESFQRYVAEQKRIELEKLRREEEARLLHEARTKELRKRIGDAKGRRELALHDFAEAARAALATGDAEYLDHRQAHGRNEMVVTFRVIQRRFECTCDMKTLRIIDSGICLTDHNTGIKSDERFTLETLPSVIREADRGRKLVVYRHVDGDNDRPGDFDNDDDDWRDD
jgi:hypothetical protein